MFTETQHVNATEKQTAGDADPNINWPAWYPLGGPLAPSELHVIEFVPGSIPSTEIFRRVVENYVICLIHSNNATQNGFVLSLTRGFKTATHGSCTVGHLILPLTTRVHRRRHTKIPRQIRRGVPRGAYFGDCVTMERRSKRLTNVSANSSTHKSTFSAIERLCSKLMFVFMSVPKWCRFLCHVLFMQDSNSSLDRSPFSHTGAAAPGTRSHASSRYTHKSSPC